MRPPTLRSWAAHPTLYPTAHSRWPQAGQHPVDTALLAHARGHGLQRRMPARGFLWEGSPGLCFQCCGGRGGLRGAGRGTRIGRGAVRRASPKHHLTCLLVCTPSGVSTTRRGHSGPTRHCSELAAPKVRCKRNPTSCWGSRRDTWCELQPQDCLPVCEVGVSGVGAATSCVPLSRPEAVEGSPRVAGFRECLNRSSRSRRSRSASSAARLAPWEGKRRTNRIW